MEETQAAVVAAAGSLAATLRKLGRKGAKRLRGTTTPTPPPTPPAIASIATLLQVVCSEPWAAAAQAAMNDGRARRCRNLGPVWRALWFGNKHPNAFFYPPREPDRPGHPVRRSLMRCCPGCGVDCPMPAVQSDYCVDCRENLNAREEGPGGAEAAREELVNDPKEVRRLTQFIPGVGVFEWGDGFGDARLKAESDAALRKEIRRYQKGQWRPEPWRGRRRAPNIRGT